MEYLEFIKNKKKYHIQSGFELNRDELSNILFDYQKDLILWSLKLGKSALFTMTGTGKTLMQLSFANEVYKKTKYNILILTPLGVMFQTIQEAKNKLNLYVHDLKKNNFILKNGINIINYESIHNINPKDYNCVILDESSILKNFSGKIRNELIESFKHCQYKLCCTATPSPNDFTELGNTAEFLDVIKRKEMLSMFFIHDSSNTQTWRIKGHAKNEFWFWVSSWSSVMIDPSDLGYDNFTFKLPKLNINEIKIDTDVKFKNELFSIEAETLQERRQARKLSVIEKVKKISDIINASSDIHLVWCDLNIESDMLKKNINNSIEIKGSDKSEYKEKYMLEFAKGNVKCLITKPSIAGLGMNWQVCNNIHFIGLSDSFEMYFQAIRRVWRYGQKKDVNVNIYTSNLEGSILRNIKRKEKDMMIMLDSMRKNTKKYVIDNIKHNAIIDSNYNALFNISIPNWLISEKGD